MCEKRSECEVRRGCVCYGVPGESGVYERKCEVCLVESVVRVE